MLRKRLLRLRQRPKLQREGPSGGGGGAGSVGGPPPGGDFDTKSGDRQLPLIDTTTSNMLSIAMVSLHILFK